MTRSIATAVVPGPDAARATRPPAAEAKRNDTRAPAPQPRNALAFFLLAAPILIAVAGCAPRTPPPTLDRATRADLDGPWDFLQAAIAAAQREHEMATLAEWSPEPGVRVYEMLTITDERVVLRAETTAPLDAPSSRFEPGDLSLAVRVGLWGDHEREEAIIRTITARLEALRRNPPRR